MCGILGTTYKNGDMISALNKIQHRGPDGIKYKMLPDCNLGFVRLAIRDLSEAAMQPMSNSNMDVWITYNGEIYGENELKENLIKKGYIFQTT
ncbi:MAG: asparagine synthetase B, partial [Roseburia sp.]